MRTKNIPTAIAIAVAVVTVVAAMQPSWAQKMNGPVGARVTEVVDGDTVKAVIRIWLNTYVEESIRVAGIDTPELRARCPSEKEKAQEAKKFLQALVEGKNVILKDIDRDKYGRLLARIFLTGVEDVSEAMINSGLARPYEGGRREGWCD